MKLAIVLGLLVVLGLFVRFYFFSSKVVITNSQGQTASNISSSTSDISAWLKLRDSENNFEVKYPRGIFKRIYPQIIAPLSSQDKVKAIGIAHYSNSKYCDLSGRLEGCTASTTDIAINFFSVERNFNDVFKDLKKNYGEIMEVMTIDGHQGVSFLIGAEGEGVEYIVLPINSAQTLFIARSYLDERVNLAYKNVSDFIKIKEQESIFVKIISTLTFRPSL